MITLDFLNCSEKKTGKKHGISEGKFEEALKKYENIKKILKNKDLGFLELPFQTEEQIKEIEKEAASIQKNFKNIFFIGIGGSALGGMALVKSLKPFSRKGPQLFFLDNPDSSTITSLLETVDLTKTLLIPISKSGGTIESLALFSILYDKLIKKVGRNKAKKHVIVITEDNHGPLAKLQKEEEFKHYSVPQNVGGRFSVLSNVGLLPAAIAGIQIKKLLQGAQKAQQEIAYRLSILQYLFYNQKEKEMTVFFPYGRRMEGIADWYIQLLAESIGKNVKVGPTPLKAVGAIDQHAQLQLFMEGPNNKLIIFLESKKEPALKIPKIFPDQVPFSYLGGHDLHELLLTERKASAEALAAQERPNMTISLPVINEESIGELLFILQLQVAFLGELFKVNAFNQPGVELGKKLIFKYLNE